MIEFCLQGNAGQEVLFLTRAQVTVRGTMFPNGGRQKSLRSVRKIGTNLGLVLIKLKIIFIKRWNVS